MRRLIPGSYYPPTTSRSIPFFLIPKLIDHGAEANKLIT